MMLLAYNNKLIDVISAIALESTHEKNSMKAVEYDRVKTMLSCLIGWLVVDIVYIDYIGYVIVKKIK